MGPYGLEYSIDAEQVTLDYPNPAVDLQLKTDSQNQYFGQTYIPEFIATGQSFNYTTFENLSNLPVNQGVGRTVYPWGIFEGTKITSNKQITAQGRFLFNDGKHAQGTAVTSTYNNTKSFTAFDQSKPKVDVFAYVKDSLRYDVRIVGKTENDL